MNKLFLLSIFSLITLHNSYSQRDTIPVTQQGGKYILQLSAISYFENYNSADIGLIKHISSNSAIGFELGYIFDMYGSNSNIDENWFKDGSGFKAYFQYRFYLDNEFNYPSNSRTFFEIEPTVFYVKYNSERVAGYSCNDDFGGCLYYRYFDTSVERFVPGLNFKVGKMYDFDPVVITLFVGAGARYIFDQPDIPTEPEPDKFFFKKGGRSEIGSGRQVNVRVGLQIGYRFK